MVMVVMVNIGLMELNMPVVVAVALFQVPLMLVMVAAAPAVLVMVVGLVAFSAVADNILKQALAEKIEVVVAVAAVAVHQQELEPMVVKV
jgi:hypothetical protein